MFTCRVLGNQHLALFSTIQIVALLWALYPEVLSVSGGVSHACSLLLGRSEPGAGRGVSHG